VCCTPSNSPLLAPFCWAARKSAFFAVYSMPLTGSGVTPDQRMDAGAQAMIDQGNRIVWQGPIEIDGARGRDYLLQASKTWTRMRLIITDADLYMLQAGATSKNALLQAAASRADAMPLNPRAAKRAIAMSARARPASRVPPWW
jgi:hypothetical protein